MTENYLKFVENQYQNQTGFDYFYSDLTKSIKFAQKKIKFNIYNFSTSNDKENTGFITLLHNITDVNKGIFGFFECIDDDKTFFELWNKLVDKAKELNINKLIGPINASIWFQYRLISFTTSEPCFNSEIISQNYYFKFFEKLQNTIKIEYHSAFRRKFETIISLTESSYKLAISEGYKIEKVESPNFEQIKQIFNLSEIIFLQNWGYSKISLDEFLQIYNTEKIDKYIGSIYLLLKEENIIGFASNINYDNTLVMKTIGILPKFQSLGLGNALVYKIHFDALRNGIEKIIYALVRKTNKVKYFPNDDIQVFREYLAFEIEI